MCVWNSRFTTHLVSKWLHLTQWCQTTSPVGVKIEICTSQSVLINKSNEHLNKKSNELILKPPHWHVVPNPKQLQISSQPIKWQNVFRNRSRCVCGVIEYTWVSFRRPSLPEDQTLCRISSTFSQSMPLATIPTVIPPQLNTVGTNSSYSAYSELPRRWLKQTTRTIRTIWTRIFRTSTKAKNQGSAQRAAYLEHLLPFDAQLYEPGSQMALDLFARCSARHVDFDKDLLHGLVPGTPGGLTGDHTAPLLEVHRHVAVPLAGRLTKH